MSGAVGIEQTEQNWGLLIGEEERPARSGDQLEIIDPATARCMAHVPDAGGEDVDDAIRVARTALDSGPWGRVGRHERARLLFRLAEVLDANLEMLFRLETANNGRPIIETRAQLARLPEFYEYTAGLLLAQRDETVPVKGPYLTYLLRRPIGVCGIVTPFNHPLLVLARPLSAALAAGNTVLIKPSELTPLTTIVFARLALQAGFPPGVINVVTGTGARAGASLAEHPDVGKISFTGGQTGGRATATAAAARFARATTELGGKAPVVIFDDADLDVAVGGAAFAGFIAAGQTCIAGSRLLVQQTVYDEFCARLTEKIRGIRVGPPADPSTQLGPVISLNQHKRVLDYLAVGKDEGAVLRAGGGVPTLPAPYSSGYFVEPSLFTNAHNDMHIAQEEIFGPVVVAIPFVDEDDAVRQANDVAFGLGSSIWTRDIARAHRVAARLEAGMTWINDHHRLDPSLPWGGLKASGVGKEGGREGFDDYSELRAVIVRTDDSGTDWYGPAQPDRLN